MKIKRILVSQPTPIIAEKSPFHEIALKHRVDITFQPFIKLEGVSLKEFRSQRVEILDHTAILFTSRTTIDNFFRICEEARIAIPEHMKYFCTTEAVALYLQKYIVYRKRKIFFADGLFSNFIDLLVKHKTERFLLTLSEPHKPEMPLAMEKLRLNFSKVILARTVSAELGELQVNDYDLLVFYSPSEIASLMGHFSSVDPHTRIATFGHSTTKAAIDEGLTIHVMAPTPAVPSMTKAIDLYLAQVNAGQQVSVVTLESESPDLAYIQAQEAKPTRRTRTVKPTTAKPTTAKSTTAKASAPKATATKSVTAKPATKVAAKPAVTKPTGAKAATTKATK